MARHGLVWSFASRAVACLPALLLAGCATLEAVRPGSPGPPGGIRVEFEDTLAPEAFVWTGRAVADAPDGAPGLWAVTPGLRQPERARVEHLETGAEAVVALYAGRGAAGGAARLSAEAAETLGVGAEGAPVRVTALRREPRIAKR
jgi:hypothetical protein